MAKILTATEIFLDGLRNAHALEKQALSIMQPQLNRLEHYPELLELLERHKRETEGQIERLDEILASLEGSASGLKDASLSLTGTLAAVGHTFAEDEILKNSFANYAFENFEIATYVSLITLAKICNADTAVPLLEKSLEEERRMAASIYETLDVTTRRYVELGASDERADI